MIRGVGINPNKYLHINIKKRFITFCGRMIKEKGIEDFFFLIQNLKFKHNYSFKLLLRLGESYNNDYLDYVKQMSKLLKVDLIFNTDKVDFYLAHTKYFNNKSSNY